MHYMQHPCFQTTVGSWNEGYHQPRSQAPPSFSSLLPYWKQWKAGWGLGTRLGYHYYYEL